MMKVFLQCLDNSKETYDAVKALLPNCEVINEYDPNATEFNDFDSASKLIAKAAPADAIVIQTETAIKRFPQSRLNAPFILEWIANLCNKPLISVVYAAPMPIPTTEPVEPTQPKED